MMYPSSKPLWVCIGGGSQDTRSSPGPGPDSTCTLSGADDGAETRKKYIYFNFIDEQQKCLAG